MAENKRSRPPKVAITEAMLLAANTALDNIQGREDVMGEEVGDATMVSEIFVAMWDAYWCEIHDTAVRKSKAPAIVMPKSSLILPKTN